MTENDRVDALVAGAWDDLIEIEPLMGTIVGDGRYDDRLSDPSEAGRDHQQRVFRGALAGAASIDRSLIDDDHAATLDILDAISARFLAKLDNRIDRLEVANHLFGPAALLGEVASIQQADTPERLDRYEGRLRAFSAFLEASEDIAREAVDSGVVAPRVVAERAIGQLDRVLALDAEDSPALMPVGEDPEARERIAGVVRDVVNPAHSRFRDVLRHELLPVATETIGLSDLPGGDGMYAAEILGWPALALEPEAVHRLGLERLAAIQEERSAVAAGLGFASPAAAIADRTARGENTASSPEALVAMAEDQVRRSWEAAPAFFGRLPEVNCQVRRVEAFREADSPFAFYNQATEDGSRPGIYYINAYGLDDRALHHVASVTYHEANPGHHFQIAIEQEMTDRPLLRRFGTILAGAAFVEGWGLYAERLADMMGLYLDEWERMGMLENQAHRAARLVTDTGIHALGWTRDAAIATLEESGLTHVDSVIEVDRYIGMPAQALCYMIGMIEMEKARDAEHARLGTAFSLQGFHDHVLDLGQLPLPSFRRVFGTG